jgi:hypothetical protein
VIRQEDRNVRAAIDVIQIHDYAGIRR